MARDRSRERSPRHRGRDSRHDRGRADERDGRRDRSRDRGRRERDERDKSRDGGRGKRHRSGEPDRKEKDRRHRDRDRGESRDKERGRNRSKSTDKRHDEPQDVVMDQEEVLPGPPAALNLDADITPEELQMMQTMGIPFDFNTTQGQHVDDNASNLGGVKVKQTRRARQYMNRKGGFNRNLPSERTGTTALRD